MNEPGKQTALAIIESLPDDTSLEEIAYRLLLRQHIDEGLRDLEAGRTVPHEEIERELAEWLESPGQ
jgi:predicted transcriptional regulator